MSLNVMYSSNDRLICDSAQGVVRGALDEHGSALVLVPDFRAQLVASRELAAAGLGLGVRIETPASWARERWDVWGDGTRVVSPVARDLAIRSLLASQGDACPLDSNPGTVTVISRLAREALPWLKASLDALDAEKSPASAALTSAEREAVLLAIAYGESLPARSLVEECQVMDSVVGSIVEGGGAPSLAPVVLAGFSGLSRAERELVCDLAAQVEVTLVRPCGDSPAFAEMDRAVDLLEAASASDGGFDLMTTCIDVMMPDDGRDAELSSLLASLFRVSGATSATGAVSLLEPLGPLAEAECVAREVERLASLGDESVVISCPDVARMWRELAPKLAARGIAVRAQVLEPALELEAGRAFMQFADSVASLSALAETWPEPEQTEEGTRLVLADMDWWPPKQVVDFLLSDISHVPTSRALRLDAAWRADRLLTPADVLSELQSERATSREVAAATRELLKGRLGSAASKLVAPFAAGGEREVEDRIQSELDDEAFREVSRPDDPLSDARATGALGAVLSVASSLKEQGVAADLEPGSAAALREIVDAASFALDRLGVVVRPEAAVPGARCTATIASFAQAAREQALSCDAAIICGQTSVESPVGGTDDVCDCIVEALGIVDAPDPLESARGTFYRQVAAARRHVSLERTLFNSEAKECYPSVMLSELLSCYASPEADDPSTGLSTTRLGEVDAAANLTATGHAPALVERDHASSAGVVSGPSRALVNVPREGRLDLVDGKPMLSASQIETYLDCPYKWFSLRRLRLQDVDAGFGPMEMGTFAHRVLEVTHATMLAEALAAAGLDEKSVDDPRVRVPGSRVVEGDDSGLERARKILDDEFDLHLLHQTILEGKNRRYQAFVAHDASQEDQLATLRRDLESVLDYEAGLFLGFEPRLFEWGFGRRGELVEYAGAWINGTIDRVDVDAHGNALVIDYKHKSSAGFMREYGAMSAEGDSGEFVLPRRVQSLVYGQVVRRSRPELSVKASLYLSTRGEEHTLSGAVDANLADKVFGSHEPSSRGLDAMAVGSADAFGCENSRGMDALLDATEERIAEQVENMVAGRIEANPRDATSCAFCPVMKCEKRISK